MPKGTITSASPAAVCGFIRTDAGEDIVIPRSTLRTSPSLKPGDEVEFDVVNSSPRGSISTDSGNVIEIRGTSHAANIKLLGAHA